LVSSGQVGRSAGYDTARCHLITERQALPCGFAHCSKAHRETFTSGIQREGEVLLQFLIEAVVPSALGGVIGIVIATGA
jgi:hypothetical protein